MFTFNSKVSHVVFGKKQEEQEQEQEDLTSTIDSKMSSQYHMPSRTCHFNLHRAN